MECEIAEFYKCSERTARKTFFCCECNATIRKGEKHLYARGKWDGRFDAFRQHMLCGAACMFIRDMDQTNYDGCVPFGGLKAYYGETNESDWPKKLRAMMRQISERERQEAVSC